MMSGEDDVSEAQHAVICNQQRLKVGLRSLELTVWNTKHPRSLSARLSRVAAQAATLIINLQGSLHLSQRQLFQ